MLIVFTRNLFCLFLVVAFCISAFAQEEKESLAELFFRYGVLAPTSDEERVQIQEWALRVREPELQWIWTQLRSRPLQSALTVFACYTSPFKSQVGKLEWSESETAKYADVDSMHAYLLRTLDEIRELFASGYEPTALTFAQTQQEPSFVAKTTLTGEEVRICGLTEEAERLILGQMHRYLKENNLHLHHILYFGSRVMPRSELVKREQNLKLPMDEGGLKKDRVRVKGLTTLSDLEMLLVVSSPNELSREGLRYLKRKFKGQLEIVFREFSVSPNFLVAGNTLKTEDPFEFIKAAYEEAHHKVLSPHQFAPVALVVGPRVYGDDPGAFGEALDAQDANLASIRSMNRAILSDGREIAVVVRPTPADGDCGFHAVDIPRAEYVTRVVSYYKGDGKGNPRFMALIQEAMRRIGALNIDDWAVRYTDYLDITNMAILSLLFDVRIFVYTVEPERGNRFVPLMDEEATIHEGRAARDVHMAQIALDPMHPQGDIALNHFERLLVVDEDAQAMAAASIVANAAATLLAPAFFLMMQNKPSSRMVQRQECSGSPTGVAPVDDQLTCRDELGFIRR